MTTSCTDWKHPYFEQFFKNWPNSKDKIDFFTGKDNVHRMRFVSLGEALDFISFGNGNSCFWDLNTKGMIRFIRKWMINQEPRTTWKHTPIEGLKGSYRVEVEKKNLIIGGIILIEIGMKNYLILILVNVLLKGIRKQ